MRQTSASMTFDGSILVLKDVELHVPIVDMLEHNPSSGWEYHVKADDICDGIGPHAFDSRFHHVEYVPDDKTPLMEQTRCLLQLAARGMPVHIKEDCPELEGYLNRKIYSLMRNKDIVKCNLEERELHSVLIRREVLRNHGLYGRLHRMSVALSSDFYQLPTVSIIVATKRPEFVGRIIRMIDLQTYPNVEVILALHGEDFEHGYDISTPNHIINISSRESLGNALRYATDLAKGDLIAKMDDDDIYDIEHIWDLVLAYQYSSARLVSKTCKYHYLVDSKELKVRSAGMSEIPIIHSLGAILLIDRNTLYRAGGWSDVHHGEDLALSKSVRKMGRKIYRTHGYGYICMRYDRCDSNHEHTSRLSDHAFDVHLDMTNISLKKMGFSDAFLNLAEQEGFFLIIRA